MKDLGIKVIGAPIYGGGSAKGAVMSINGSKPDSSGNINVATMTDEEKETILQEVQAAVDKVEGIDMSGYATKEEVYSLIASIQQFNIVVVSDLPAASADTMNKIYIVVRKDEPDKGYYDIIGHFDNEEHSENSHQDIDNTADEYITISTTTDGNTFYRWEKIGSTDIDMSGYATEEKVEEIAEDVDDMRESMDQLLDATFPIVIGLSASKAGMNHKITLAVTEQGVKYVPDTLTLTQTSFKQTTETTTFEGIRNEFAAAPGASLTIETPIKANRETFALFAASSGRTPKSTSITRYICYSGASAKEALEASDIEALTMAYASGVAFNPSITTGDSQYMYILVPSHLAIKKITSAGFDVTLDDSVPTISTELGVFKVYRTANRLTANTWNLVIS